MKICIIGTGYVGLVTGTCFAEMGNEVWCFDIDEKKINILNAGEVPIFEPGLKELIERNRRNNRLHFTTDFKEAVKDTLFCFIAVGTPPGEDGSADLQYVLNAAQAIGREINNYTIIVNKSTVPVGTAEKVRAMIYEQLKARNSGELEFDVVSNPEFLKEGSAIEDFMRPDRIIVGTNNVRSAEFIKQLYEPFVRNEHPIYIMDIKSAEISKYAANAMLATRISFMNEIAKLCDAVGADVNNVRVGIGSDKRIGMPFLYPGIGYGGSCFPKDVQALIRIGHEYGTTMNVITAVEIVNHQQKHYMVEMIIKKYGKDLKDRTFGVWGLAFKPQTDDMREAPAIIIINELIRYGAQIVAYDPEAIEQAKNTFKDVPLQRLRYVSDKMDVVADIDALLLLTEWREFRQTDFTIVKDKMKEAVIFDGRNQYNPQKMQEIGFEYYCIGRGKNVY